MIISGPVTVANVSLGRRAEATLGSVTEYLQSEGVELRSVDVPLSGLPRRLPAESKAMWRSFVATPEVLQESWRVAQHIEALTKPGDAVLVSELAAASGVFALMQAMRPSAERRRVLIAAGDGEMLQYLTVAGSYEGVDAQSESAIDWEIVGYRFADAVLATSVRAARLLAGEGLEAVAVGIPAQDATSVPARSGLPRTVSLPEPVSRLSQTAAILRGLSNVVDAVHDVRVYVSPEDRPDHLWKETSWEAAAGVRYLLGDSVERTSAPPMPDAVVLGDPFAVPDDELKALRAAGALMVVPAGSVAAMRWPEARVWSSEDDIVTALTIPGEGPTAWPEPPTVELRERPSDPSRGLRVSVGVPVFEDVRFLDDCIESLLAQKQPPHEVILVDDGSVAPEVTAAIERWLEHSLVRAVYQPNRGVCVARNAALDLMTGDAFVFVDADDVLHPEFISACSTALKSNPDALAVACWTEFFGDYEGIEAKPPFDHRVGLRENPIVSTSALVDMKVRELGIRFASDLAFIYCEDWDVWAQIAAAGGKFGLVPRPLARHRVHAASGGHQRTDLGHAIGKARATQHLRRSGM